MYPLSDELTEALAAAGVVAVARLTCLWPDGSTRQVFDLDQRVILGGTVRAELRRDVRRDGSLSLKDVGPFALAPVAIDDMLARGSRAVIERGAIVRGEPVHVPLIKGYVTGCQPTMRGSIALSIESHLSACAQDAGAGFLIPAGTFLPDALFMLWGGILVGVEWTVEEVAASRSLGADIPVLATDNILDVGIRIARDLGCVAYDDRVGRVVVRARPDPTKQATVGVMEEPVDLSRSIGLQPVNGQGVEGTPGDGEPFFIFEEVDDQASPIHRDRIGLRVAPTIRSDTLSDPAAGRAMARSVLAARSMAQDSLTVTNLPKHLDKDEGDVVERQEAVSATGGRFLLESVSYPVGPGYVDTTESSVVPLFLSDL